MQTTKLAAPSCQQTARHRWQGLVNRSAGQEFEERLEISFEWYRQKGKASIKKTPEPMRILQRLEEGRFIACFQKKAQPDYKGTLKGGRSILLEAKYTSRPQIKKEAVSKEQADFMEENCALGALGFVIFGFSSGHVYRLPWHMWRDMKQWFGRQYITESDALLDQYRLTPGPGGVLPLLEQLEEENQHAE